MKESNIRNGEWLWFYRYDMGFVEGLVHQTDDKVTSFLVDNTFFTIRNGYVYGTKKDALLATIETLDVLEIHAEQELKSIRDQKRKLMEAYL